MNITEASIKFSRVTLVTLMLILIGGWSYFQSAPKAEDPGFTIKIAQVRTYFPGASPERVEQLVTDKLEKAIQEMPEVKHVTSTSKTGISIVEVEIHPSFRGAATRPVWDKLRRKVQDAEPQLPQGISGPFVNDEFGDVFGVIIGLTGDGYDYAELKDMADDLRDELLAIPEAAKVEIYGAQDERVYIEFRLERLAEMGLSPDQLYGILSAQNIVQSGGSVERNGKRYVFEPTGNYETVQDIHDTLIRLPNSRHSVALGEIADVERGYIDPPNSFFHNTGTPGLAIAVSMREGGNILVLGEDVKKKMAELDEIYPWGLNFNIVNFQPEDVANTIEGFTLSLLQSLGVVLLSMLVFLGLRTGLVVASLIPLAIGATMVSMGAFDMGLDKVSLAALVIALGLLVDNAVVMSESTLTRMEEGMSRTKAAIESAVELRTPLFISSLTTISAFMPLPLAENDMGEFLGPLAIVLAITLVASWVMSITAIPWLCSIFLRTNNEGNEGKDPYDTKFYRVYRGILLSILKHRVAALAVIALLFFSSLQVLGTVPKVFMSESNLPSFTIELDGIQGTDLKRTQETTQEIERWLTDEFLITEEEANEGKEGLLKWATYVGNGGPRFYLNFQPEDPSPQFAIIVPTATSGDTAAKLIPKIRDYLVDNYPDIQPIVKLRSSGGGASSPVGYQISGKDTAEVFRIVEELKNQLRQVNGVVNIRDDWGMKTKKVIVDIDDNRLKRAGLTNQEVASSLRVSSEGFEVTQFRDGDDLIPTIMRAKAKMSGDKTGQVGALTVFSSEDSNPVPLGQVAKIELAFEPPVVRRKDRVATVEVQANITESITASEVNTLITPWLKNQAKSWPPGFTFYVTGDSEKSNDATSAIGEKLPLAGFLIVMLLVLQFNSLRQSFIVLLTIPLSVIGVAYGLKIGGSYFGFMAFLGLLSLAGIVINNAIVLIDRMRIEEEAGATKQDAILAAALKRLRPILLTTVTTVLGLFPLWFGSDPMWVPMAISIIFGLVFATLLTLGLVPLMYSILYRVSFKDTEQTPTAITPS